MDAISPYFKRSMDITVFLLVDSRGPSAKIPSLHRRRASCSRRGVARSLCNPSHSHLRSIRRPHAKFDLQKTVVVHKEHTDRYTDRFIFTRMRS